MHGGGGGTCSIAVEEERRSHDAGEAAEQVRLDGKGSASPRRREGPHRWPLIKSHHGGACAQNLCACVLVAAEHAYARQLQTMPSSQTHRHRAAELVTDAAAEAEICSRAPVALAPRGHRAEATRARLQSVAPDRNGLLCSAPASAGRCRDKSAGAGSCARIGCGAERFSWTRLTPSIAAVEWLVSNAAAMLPLCGWLEKCWMQM